MSVLLIFFLSMFANAGLLTGPSNYYVVQNENTDLYANFDDGRTILMTLHRGQVLHLDGLYNAHLTVERNVGGKIVHGDITVPRADIEKVFGGKQNPENGGDQSLAVRAANGQIHLSPNPSSALTGAGGHSFPSFNVPTQTLDVRESKLIDAGRSRFVLVHNVCVAQWKTCGWIRNDALGRGPNLAAATSEAGPDSRIAKPKPCEKKDSASKLASFAEDLNQTFRSLAGDEARQRAKVEEALGPCVQAPKNFSTFNGKYAKGKKQPGTNMYDIGPRAAAESTYAKLARSVGAVKVRTETGAHALTKDDFVTIDAFARTLFGEMRSDKCLSKPHIQAVARTIINRSQDLASWGRDAGSGAKNPMMKVLLADQQYSVWNNEDEVGSNKANHNDNVRSAFCPKRNEVELDAWEESVKTAMHAVLDQKAFLRETDSLAGLTSYTSGRSSWAGHSPIKKTPELYGQKLDNPSCMKFWTAK